MRKIQTKDKTAIVEAACRKFKKLPNDELSDGPSKT